MLNGPKIRELRKAQGLKQYQLAKLANVSRVWLGMIERENPIATNPGQKIVDKLASVLKCNSADLIMNAPQDQYIEDLILRGIDLLSKTGTPEQIREIKKRIRGIKE